MHHLIECRDQVVVKGYQFLYFAQNMKKSVSKSICKNQKIKQKIKSETF